MQSYKIVLKYKIVLRKKSLTVLLYYTSITIQQQSIKIRKLTPPLYQFVKNIRKIAQKISESRD